MCPRDNFWNFMNLQEFLNYRTNCLVCGENLYTKFHSNRKQSIKIIDDIFSVRFFVHNLNTKHFIGNSNGKYSKYKIEYNIKLNDNSVYIDFYDEYNKKLEYIERQLIDYYHQFDRHMFSYKIYKICYCGQYAYHSNNFNIDYYNQSIGKLDINSENICTSYNDKTFHVINFYTKNETLISLNGMFHPNPYQSLYGLKDDELISTKIIKFDKNLGERLSKLLIFT